MTPRPRTVLTVWPEGKARLRSLGYFPGEGAWSRAAQCLSRLAALAILPEGPTDLGQLKVVQNAYFQSEPQSAQVLLTELIHNAAALLDLPDQYAGLTDSVRSRWRNAIARFA